MRIYEGSPRQDFEEVFRSIDTFLDQRGMKDVLLVEAPDGFIVQGLVDLRAIRRGPGRVDGRAGRGTLTFLDDDIAQFMEEAATSRPRPKFRCRAMAGCCETRSASSVVTWTTRKPRDVFFFEQDGAFVVRLLLSGQAGSGHQLAEFTREDIGADGRPGPGAPASGHDPGRQQHDHQRLMEVNMKALETVAVALGITLAALIVIPLAVLAGLFVWLKLTEEDDEELLELDRDAV